MEEAKVHAEVAVIVQTMLLYVVIGVTAKSHVIPIVEVEEEEEVADLAVVVETAEVAQVVSQTRMPIANMLKGKNILFVFIRRWWRWSRQLPCSI